MTTKRHMWKNHFIFFFCIFITNSFQFWRCSMKGAALPKEPHMVAFAKGSSNSHVAYKHFVAWRINLIHNIIVRWKKLVFSTDYDNMLNKFIIEFKISLFSYFFISHSCFSRIFVKIYILMASLKQNRQTSVVTLFSFSQ